MQPLPIDPLLPEIIASLAKTPRLVLAAPPGAGKTTRVPRAMLEAGFAADGEIVVLEPRRLAARLAARRVADELGERLGETVGYQVRFEDVSSAKTRIRFVTEGVLTRKLLADRELRGVAAVVLDEFHERHLQGDLALALLGGARRTLPIVVMSATLAAEPIAAFLRAPVLRAEGRLFDVAVEHLPAPDDRPLASQVASAVRRLAREGPPGDILVFLPGAAEIRRAREACEDVARDHDLVLLVLHGDLPPAEQDRAVRRADKHKVILSTNVAESSVTIDGVVAVVDGGLARVASHAPWSGLPRLRVEKVSRASATQRAGRAGRTCPGRCLRLYTKADFDARPEHDVAEIHRADLAETVLDLAAAAVSNIAWFEPPPEESLRAATELLAAMGALDAGRAVTKVGKQMARLAVHPRAARMLVEAEARGVSDDACVLAALLGERDIRESSRGRAGFQGGPRTYAGATERSDLVASLDLFREAEASGFAAHALRSIGLDAGATLAVDRTQRELGRALRASRRGGGDRSAKEAEDDLLRCVLAGYPDRVARRLRPGARSVAIAGGRAGDIAETSAVRDAMWMVAVDADGGGRGVSVRVASAIEPDWLMDLFPGEIREAIEVRWDAGAKRVVAMERLVYAGLTLFEAPREDAPEDEVTRVLAAAALDAGPRAFESEDALDHWLLRARFAMSVDRDIPAPSDDDVRAALVETCRGKKSFAELREAGLLAALRARLGAKASAVERLAPERITMAGGRSAAVTYEAGKPPWMESHLQDFFGMRETPRVGGGRVPVVLHLLAPNRRAVQITSDLAGFWERHYPAVRKELMRKYPRHSWPEDPTQPAPRYRRESR